MFSTFESPYNGLAVQRVCAVATTAQKQQRLGNKVMQLHLKITSLQLIWNSD